MRTLCSPLPPPPAAGKWRPGLEAHDPDSPLLVSGRKLRRSSCPLAAPYPGPLPPTLLLVSDLLCRPPAQSVSVRGQHSWDGREVGGQGSGFIERDLGMEPPLSQTLSGEGP